jgi:hypothetical protein
MRDEVGGAGQRGMEVGDQHMWEISTNASHWMLLLQSVRHTTDPLGQTNQCQPQACCLSVDERQVTGRGVTREPNTCGIDHLVQ